MIEQDILCYISFKPEYINKVYQHKDKFSENGIKCLEILKNKHQNGEEIGFNVLENLVPDDYLKGVINSNAYLMEQKGKTIDQVLLSLEKEYARKIAEGITKSDDIKDIEEKINSLNTVFAKTKSVEVINLKQAGMRFFDNIDKTADPRYYVKTRNWSILNKVMKFTKGDVIIVAGRPAMGKSAFALSLAIELAKNSCKGIFFSLEMGEEQLINRIVSQLSQVEIQKLQSKEEYNKTTNDECNRLTKAIEEMSRLSEYLKLVSGSFSTADVLDIVEQEKPQYIIIDYVQLLRTQSRSGRTEEVQRISMELKALAMKYKIVVIELAQLSRAVESRPDRRPTLSDLKETSQLEQDASGVMMLYRNSYYVENDEDKTKLELLIRKNRNGPVGVINYNFFGEIQKVGERI